MSKEKETTTMIEIMERTCRYTKVFEEIDKMIMSLTPIKDDNYRNIGIMVLKSLKKRINARFSGAVHISDICLFQALSPYSD